MARGEAYWVFSRGASSYQAPLGLELNLGDGLDFGVELTELAPSLRNLDSSAKSVSIRDQTLAGSSLLSYFRFANNAYSWANLPTPHTLSLGGRASSTGSISLRLAVRRKDFPTDSIHYTSILEINDNAGTRYLVPVTASRLMAARSSLASSPPVGAGAKVAGLWVGSVSINKVNEPNSTNDAVTPRPTRSPFNLRLLVHVNDQGQPRLLKEVLQMWQESTRKPDGTPDQLGRFVLLTDDSLIPSFSGSALRGGESVGRRISTADYDFAAGTSNYLAMTGTFGLGQQISCMISLGPDFPTNPFKHSYHPDHDNLPAGLPPEQQEVYAVTRAISLTCSATDPEGPSGVSAIEYGDSIIGGTYRESITGLHKATLEVEGTFRLRRVNNSPVLNQ
jgi:hypothetical protein